MRLVFLIIKKLQVKLMSFSYTQRKNIQVQPIFCYIGIVKKGTKRSQGTKPRTLLGVCLSVWK